MLALIYFTSYESDEFIRKVPLSVDNLEPYKECAGLCRAIEVARVAELATVQVGLEVVQDVLHTRVHLQLDVVV